MTSSDLIRRVRPYVSGLLVLAVMAGFAWYQDRDTSDEPAVAATAASDDASDPSSSDTADNDTADNDTANTAGDDAANDDAGDDSTASEDPSEGGGGEPVSNLPTISVDDLPPEAWATMAAIDQGGPYEFDRDDIVFQNREGLLPDAATGYYREYTVITPGIDHRGARRIVVGADGERYYTDDHYESFREIVQ